jgi:Mrp family chromosome partitioning ATPase
MVVQDRQTTHDEFERAISALKFAEANLLGVILNGSVESTEKYSSKSQKYGYY